MQNKIAIVGSGISGLVSAHLLSKNYDVTLFEAEDYVGGHTHTIDVEHNGELYAIDTGFIVFNKKTYPNFCKLLDQLGIAVQKSEMSFSFSSNFMDMEYKGHTLNTLFADRKNILKPKFYKMLRDILHFNNQAKKYLASNISDISIAQFIEKYNYSALFINAYFLPMAAAIWSAKPSSIYATSSKFIFAFFANHGLLDVINRPTWYVIKGGSRNYIAPLVHPFHEKIFCNAKVESIRSHDSKVVLYVNGEEVVFDKVIIATHSDQALKMLTNPTKEQHEILSRIPYQTNEVILHADTRVLPSRRVAWASWNYLDTNRDNVGLTYYMNRLQNINAPIDFCVSVNLGEYIQPDKIFKKYTYSHPCFNQQAINAQKKYAEINGNQNIYFCGAYWGFGFHEDGVKSALNVCASLGETW